MCGVAGVTRNRGSFPGEAGGVYVLQGREWEWGTNDLTSCVHYALQCFPAVFSTATAPHSDRGYMDSNNCLSRTEIALSVSCKHLSRIVVGPHIVGLTPLDNSIRSS